MKRLPYERWEYPALAKPDSDGTYCYIVQRRISAWASHHLAKYIGADTATALDLLFGVAAAVMIALDQWIGGVIFIQIFGLFSCIDGEIARIRGEATRLGDFFDTMTDRTSELLLIAAIVFSLSGRMDSSAVYAAGFVLTGAVFALTTCAEKFRSAWHMPYPKRRLERFLCMFCAGSDSRLLMLSLALIASELTGSGAILLWSLWGLSLLIYVNFLLRIGLVYKHFKADH